MLGLIFYGLAGIGAFCLFGLIVLMVVLLLMNRRDADIAKKIAELQLNDLSPSETSYAKEKWPDFYSAAFKARRSSLQQSGT